MSSPLPPDPYVALGVSKDADLAAIRTAHRKLVLKFHPDRIRDEAQREKGKNEFQKVQQAYELLSDSNRRQRYDDRIKLAELLKERMARDATRPSPSSTRTTYVPPVVRRETRSDGIHVEERAPSSSSYFDSRDAFDEAIPRTTSRKYEAAYERKPSVSKSSEKKEKSSSSSKWNTPVEGMSMKMAMHMKQRAAQAKDRTKDRDSHAQKTETRDREKRQERSEKQSRRSPYVEDGDTESGSDTVVSARHSSGPSRSSPRARAGTDPVRSHRPSPSRRQAFEDEARMSEDEKKWERHHKNSKDYIVESQIRPGPVRADSDSFWSTRDVSDGEKYNYPREPRRAVPDEMRPRPSMPSQSSAPSNLRSHTNASDREPVRARTNPYPSERERERERDRDRDRDRERDRERDRREPPSLLRSQTMPTQRASAPASAPRKEPTLPKGGSNLKHSETQQDSGYYSSSSPHTPEMRGESPPRDSPPPPPRETRKATSTKKYHIGIVEPESEDDGKRRPRVTRIIDGEDEGRRRFQSPEPERRERDYDRPREPRERPERPRVDTENRSRSAWTTTHSAESRPRAEFGRYENRSPRGSPPVSSNRFFREVSPEEPAYSQRPDPTNLRTTSYQAPATADYRSQRHRERGPDDDYPYNSRFRDNIRTSGSRRPSLAT